MKRESQGGGLGLGFRAWGEPGACERRGSEAVAAGAVIGHGGLSAGAWVDGRVLPWRVAWDEAWGLYLRRYWPEILSDAIDDVIEAL